MDASVRFEAVEAARDLLRRFQAECPNWQDVATPVEEMAAWLGCEIATFHPDDYPSGTYGFLEPGEQLIWLCRDLPATLQRFTLAHELGHVVLHSHIPLVHDLPASAHARSLPLIEPGVSSDDPCQVQDIQEELTGLFSQQQVEELLGPGATYDPRSQRELAANLFAAELLMPLEKVWELYVKQQISPDALAPLFNVSQAAILNRLAGLLGDHNAGLAEPITLEANEDFLITQPTPPEPAVRTTSKKPYDEFQQAAIEAPTPALIVAGPGSGKTSTLIGRADYLLSQQGVRPEQILALTFSRKAAQEMQERLEKILPPGLPPPTISTFHSFCAELLRTYGQRVGLRQDFELVDDAGGYFLLHSLAEDLPLRHYQNLHNPAAPFVSFLKAISRAKDELVTPTRYFELATEMLQKAENDNAIEAAERTLEIAAVYEMYQRALASRGDSDFGSLIMLTVQLLQEHADICAEVEQRYQHILVDEFQDINRASGVLLRLLAGEKQQVWVVGDANQAIYGFRGASPANIANFQADYPSARVLPLNRNYRSRPDIVSLADTFRRGILEQDPGLASVQTARMTENDPYITLAIASDEVSELRELVADVQQRLKDGYSYRDIVILCRTRAMVRKVTRALAEAGLPINERGGILEQEHVKNLLSLLLLMGDDSGMGILRAARLPAHPLDEADVEAILLEAHTRPTSPLSLILREE
ncbi:MAG TPA: UvrD-helicase domain-containing protein, partial [Ktedonobacteraceae bacterium]|nr:UvrD-helicase domain-containing protein [Ktedonobacteraceae bacterium]